MFEKVPTKNGKVVYKMESKRNLEKTKVIFFFWFPLARNAEPVLKLYNESLKIYPQVKFLGITFDSKLTFQQFFKDNVECCNTRYHHLRLLLNEKWENQNTNWMFGLTGK